jgi:rhamnosyl/mannosyltransferase
MVCQVVPKRRVMKILQIGKFYYPYKGGMETVLRGVCKGLVNSEHSVRVLCYNDCNKNEIYRDGKILVFRAGTLGTVRSQPISLSFIFTFYKLLKWSDVVHIHEPNPLATILSLFYLGKKRFVVTHHSDIYKQRLLKLLFIPFYKMFMRRVERIIVPTENHYRYSSEINELQDKCAIIPFSLERDFVQANNKIDSYLERVKENYQSPFILFVGRLVEYKGLKYLIDSMKSVDAKLVIVGKGPLRESLSAQIENSNLRDKIDLLGAVDSKEELMAYYKACSVVVLPSITPNENFGMIQLEAMAFQKPVVTTDLKSGVPCVGVNEKTCFIVKPRNPGALSEAINKLIQNPELAKKMGIEGFKRYQEKFTEKAATDSHIQVYEEVLKAS